jgi:hypothetical protein
MNNLYTALLGWSIEKLPINDTEIMIEEGDQIRHPQVMSIIIELYNSLSEGDLLRV